MFYTFNDVQGLTAQVKVWQMYLYSIFNVNILGNSYNKSSKVDFTNKLTLHTKRPEIQLFDKISSSENVIDLLISLNKNIMKAYAGFPRWLSGLRICLPIKGDTGSIPGLEGPPIWGATKPVRLNYQPVFRAHRTHASQSPCSVVREATAMRSPAPQLQSSPRPQQLEWVLPKKKKKI